MKVELTGLTIEQIEKAKRLLSSHPDFDWVKQLDISGFLHLMFGNSDLSQCIREVWLKLLEPHITRSVLKEVEPELPQPEKPIGYYTPLQAKVLKAFLKYDIPLSADQVVRITGLRKETVHYTISTALARKRLVRKIEGTFLWELDKERLKKFALRPPTIRELILDLLSKEEGLTLKEIALKIGRKLESVDAEIYGMRRKGIVVKIGEKWYLKSSYSVGVN